MKIMPLFAALLFTLVACQTAETIELGFIGPLTGDVASYGMTERHATELAIEEINARGGIRGKHVRVIYEDGACSGKEAAIAAEKLLNVDRVNIILGGGCSGETLGAAQVTEKHNAILFSAFSSSPDITTAGDYVFRNAPSDAQGGEDLARLIIDDGHMHVAILSEQTDFAHALRAVFRQHFERLGGEIVADETYGTDVKDYRTHLLKIREVAPDALILNPQSGISGGLAARQARELGIGVPLYGNMGFGSADAKATGGSALTGLKYIDAPGLSDANPQAQAFIGKFRELYGEPANEYEAAARYDSVHILADALEACGEETSCIRDYLYSLQYNGTIGMYSFDRNGDVQGIRYRMKILG